MKDLGAWVKRQGRGALAQLARETGLDYGTVYYAVKRGKPVMPRTAKLLAKATGVSVSRIPIVGLAPRAAA